MAVRVSVGRILTDNGPSPLLLMLTGAMRLLTAMEAVFGVLPTSRGRGAIALDPRRPSPAVLPSL